MGSLASLYRSLFFMLCLLHVQVISSEYLFSNSASSTTTLCHQDESIALIHFKNSFSIDIYPSSSESWKEGTDCCLWQGVICDMETGYVVGLNLSHSMLYGTFHSHSSIFFLSHLQFLDLSYNDFNFSHIPSHLGHFSNLRHLNLNNSNFVGHIPSEISQLYKLVSLDLSFNFLSIETSAFNKIFRNLTMLRELDLSYVDMSSVVASSFMNLSSSLSSFKLINCGLRGKFLEYIALFRKLVSLGLSYNSDISIETITFDKLVQNLTLLRELDLTSVNMPLVSLASLVNLSSSLVSLSLAQCKLSGKFPGVILQRPNLRLLDLGDNEDISGFLPPTSNWSDSLRYLYLSRTKIPIDFVRNFISLEELQLEECNFVGSNLAFLGNLTQLNQLYIAPNNFKGAEIPYSFGNLLKLTSLDLSNCNLSGQIPSSLGNLNQLLNLDLSYNNLNGQIPPSLGNLNQLSELHLGHNNLNGHIPSSLGNLKPLSYLSLGKNNLSGHIPSSLENLIQLSFLLFFHNNLSGSIPCFFTNLTQLLMLDLSNNQLIGPIPSQLSALSNLIGVDLSNNLLNETIPISLFTLFSLNYLVLGNNLFTGEIVQFQDNSLLTYIDLSNNNLHGPIPSSISKLVYLRALILSSNNKLIGGISSSICKLQNLQILDLSNNSLSGAIPKCLGKFSNKLEVLHMGMNYFNGTIPSTFSNDNSLRYINFYSNQFQGQVPRSLINCANLEFIHLGDNKIVDAFPSFLGALPKLQVLVLRSNKLHGLVQKFSPNYSFPSLQIFDLSNNNLSGPLPSEYFDHLEAMKMITSGPIIEYRGEQFRYFYGDIMVRGFHYSIDLTIKRLQIKMERIPDILSIIDLSQNKFTGKIPKSIGKLKSLICLNLSHNFLGDNIQPSLGNLTNLESLDLSSNFLIGRIPMQLLDLKFLQVFNVSYNQLEGPIPTGKQFNTFDNNSYEGNVGLCGFPLTEECNGGQTQQINPSKEEYSESNENEFGWEPVVVGYGCGVIFGVAIGYIVFKTRKRSWFVRMIEAEGYLWRMKFDKFKKARKSQRGRRRN